MANKRRPRKMKPPYRRYGPGPGALETGHECTAGLEDEMGALAVAETAATPSPDSDVETDVTSLAKSTGESSATDVSDDECYGLYLPPEIVDLIIAAMPRPIPVSILRVSRVWYSVGLPYLYDCPVLSVPNYSKFVDTISGSPYLGSLVKILDLRNIIQSGKNSFTARLLRRCAPSLETFIAPQTSFGYSPLVSLRQCHSLKTLDLGLVSETVDLRELFLAIRNAKKLERLEFPRSSVFCQKYDQVWPSNVHYLGLAGGISNEFVYETTFPTTVTHLSINHCPFITSECLRNLAGRLGQHLTTLKVLFPLPALRPNALDSVLRLCPKLQTLYVSVDYVSRYVFAEPNMPCDDLGHAVSHPLKYLTLDSSGMLGQAGKIHADDVCLAILEDKLPKLTHIRISNKLGWNPDEDDMCELIEVLEERNGGVWVY